MIRVILRQLHLGVPCWRHPGARGGGFLNTHAAAGPGGAGLRGRPAPRACRGRLPGTSRGPTRARVSSGASKAHPQLRLTDRTAALCQPPAPVSSPDLGVFSWSLPEGSSLAKTLDPAFFR